MRIAPAKSHTMPRFEAVCQRIFSQPQASSRLLTGGLLAFVPIINLFALGYLIRYVRNTRQGSLQLPDWADWAGLLRDGVAYFLIALVWMGVPSLLGLGVTLVLKGLFHVLLMSFFASTIAWAPFVVACVVGYLLSLLGVLRFAVTGEMQEAFQVAPVLRMAVRGLDAGLVPSLAVLGLWTIGWPLYGIAFFIGTLLLLAYFSLSLEV